MKLYKTYACHHLTHTHNIGTFKNNIIIKEKITSKTNFTSLPHAAVDYFPIIEHPKKGFIPYVKEARDFSRCRINFRLDLSV